MRQLNISITLLILACFILYASKQRATEKTSMYQLGGRPLPKWYAVCSKEGKRIYTVPEEGGVGATECVVVGDKEVVDSGSLGKQPRRAAISDCYSSYTSQMGRQGYHWSC